MSKGTEDVDFELVLEEVQELRALFDLQQTRLHDATRIWRAATGAPSNVLPDLGRLLEWMLGEIEHFKTAWQANVDSLLRMEKQYDALRRERELVVAAKEATRAEKNDFACKLSHAYWVRDQAEAECMRLRTVIERLMRGYLILCKDAVISEGRMRELLGMSIEQQREEFKRAMAEYSREYADDLSRDWNR